MTNLVSFNRLNKNYAEMPTLNQGTLPLILFADSKSNPNNYSTPHLNGSSDHNQQGLNFNPLRNGLTRDPGNYSKVKDRSIFGLYSRDGASQKARNLRGPFWDDKGYSARGSKGYPPQDIRSVLDKINLITSDIPNKDLTRKKENSISGAGGMISGLLKDPVQERSRKNEMLNEWKQTLAAQVQVRQAQKKHEADLKRKLDIADEERYQRSLDEYYNYNNTPGHREEKRPMIKDFHTYENSPVQRLYTLSPMSNNTPKYQLYAEDSIQMNFQNAREQNSLFKPFRSPPAASSAFLNNKIDQLRSDILQSQKVFSDQMKGLQSNIERRRQNQLERDYQQSDALDEYIHQQDVQRELRGQISAPRYQAPVQKSTPARNKNPKLTLPDDLDPVFDDGSIGLMFGVEGQFVSMKSDNVRMSRAQSRKALIEKEIESPRPVSVGQYRKLKSVQDRLEVRTPQERELPSKFDHLPKEEVIVPKEEEIPEQLEQEEIKVEKIDKVEETPAPVEENIMFDISPKNTEDVQEEMEFKLKENSEKKEKKEKVVEKEKEKITYNVKRAESAQKTRPPSEEKDINKMFPNQSSVFVNTSNIDTMDEFKRYIKKEATPVIPVEPKKIVLADAVNDEYAKRRLPSGVPIEKETVVGDLTEKVEKEQLRRREIKRSVVPEAPEKRL